MNTRTPPVTSPASVIGRVTWRNVDHRRAPALRRLDQRAIDPLQRHVQGEHHQRQVAVHEAEEHRELAVQDLDVGIPKIDSIRPASRIGTEDDQRGVGPDEEARPERDDEQSSSVLLLRPARMAMK